MPTQTNLLPASLLLGAIACLPLAAQAASPDDRACNQQGREIALRISEEVDSDLTATERNRIAAIAEAVCAEYSGQAAAVTPAPAPAMPVVSRPARPQAEAAAVAAPAQAPVAGEATETDEDDEGGLFDIRIIDPEDRVQRPGLKRR